MILKKYSQVLVLFSLILNSSLTLASPDCRPSATLVDNLTEVTNGAWIDDHNKTYWENNYLVIDWDGDGSDELVLVDTMSFQVLKYHEGTATLLCEYEIPHGHLFWNSKVFLKLKGERADNANLAIVYNRFVQYWDTTQSKITEVRNFNTDYEPDTLFDITGDGIDDVKIIILDKENERFWLKTLALMTQSEELHETGSRMRTDGNEVYLFEFNKLDRDKISAGGDSISYFTLKRLSDNATLTLEYQYNTHFFNSSPPLSRYGQYPYFEQKPYIVRDRSKIPYMILPLADKQFIHINLDTMEAASVPEYNRIDSFFGVLDWNNDGVLEELRYRDNRSRSIFGELIEDTSRTSKIYLKDIDGNTTTIADLSYSELATFVGSRRLANDD